MALSIVPMLFDLRETRHRKTDSPEWGRRTDFPKVLQVLRNYPARGNNSGMPSRSLLSHPLLRRSSSMPVPPSHKRSMRSRNDGNDVPPPQRMR